MTVRASPPLLPLLVVGALTACGPVPPAPAQPQASRSEAAPASQTPAPTRAVPPATSQSQSEEASPEAAELPRKPVWNPDGSIEVLTWDDLMPEGEEEELAKLYDEFYSNLDKMVLGRQFQLNAPSGTQDLTAIIEGSSLDYMPQLGTFNTVADLNNLNVKLPGFVVPLDFRSDKTYREFLLVPYFGACLHTPPPPPNQIVFVRAKEPVTIADLWSPVWVEGQLQTQRHENDVGSAAYTLTLSRMTPYESR